MILLNNYYFLNKMKQITIKTIVLVAAVSTALLLPSQASAFWPFDWIQGQVKGATTQLNEPHPGAFGGLLDKMLGKKDNNQNVGSSEKNDSLTPKPTKTQTDFKVTLTQAVASGKISQAQADEILSRLNAISVKEQELTALRKSLADWFKANNLSTAILSGEVVKKPSGVSDFHPPRPSGRPSGTENRR